MNYNTEEILSHIQNVDAYNVSILNFQIPDVISRLMKNTSFTCSLINTHRCSPVLFDKVNIRLLSTPDFPIKGFSKMENLPVYNPLLPLMMRGLIPN